MTLEDFELRDPEALIALLADEVPLLEDTAYAVLVRNPSTDQEVVEIRRLGLPALLDDDDDISDDLVALAESFRLPDVRPPKHAVVTILVRPGRCIYGPNENVWFKGWRYSNHFQAFYDSDMILVTEYGWAHFLSEVAGYEPRMVA